MYKAAATLALLGLAMNVQADDLSRPDAHAPIGVMGDHTHHEGEIMLSYRAMDMKMEGNRSGSNRLATSEVLRPTPMVPTRTGTYMVAPLNMDMKMHMIGAMYAPTSDLTLMAMLPSVSLDMDHVTAMNANFTTSSTGIGDLKVGGLYNLKKSNGNNLILNATLSLPTGSIDEKGVTPISKGNAVQLPYPMQLGSGTYDLIPGLTYTSLQDTFSWGSQIKATFRLGDNDNGYTLGDRFALSSWIAKPVHKNISISARLSHDNWQDIDGVDSKLNVPGLNFVATADPSLRAGKRTDLGLGLNFVFKGDNVSNHRIALEYSRPVHQDLDGPQLETDQIVTLGYQVAL